ncbi:hypothetical protein LSH36_7g15015 [Paralvinella palmiformis]|uniref:Cyclin A n=1 Tax=Paralvinella palmiformis TaxID=53620 RepID=A0AAD9KET9_9ANNE|nr:hypothetical protein LSH36_7g15015 [Paralvinella palmiformis]
MSSAYEEFTGFAVHEDNENISARKTKRHDLQGQAPANKRAALGTITNTDDLRVQPRRTAKQGFIHDENSYPGEGKCLQIQSSQLYKINATQQRQTFAIHVDDTESGQNGSDVSAVNLESSAVLQPPFNASLHQTERISIDSPGIKDSPMLLDETCISIDDEESRCKEGLRKVLTVPQYSSDIYAYLREAELRNRPKTGYMRKQPDITINMRSILVDWLVEVAEEYKLHRETLCLSVNYIDRFLSQMSVVRGKLQLVGAASMFLAAKYEEIYPPEVREFVYITDDTYTKKQVLRMEHLVLKVLSFDVAVPTFNWFCEKFLHDLDADEKTSSLAMYLAELTMIESEPFLNYLPSVIAASAICLANITLKQDPWPHCMVESTGYGMGDLNDCIQHMYSAFCKAPHSPQQAVREKYKLDKYHQVSQLAPPPVLPTAMPPLM